MRNSDRAPPTHQPHCTPAPPGIKLPTIEASCASWQIERNPMIVHRKTIPSTGRCLCRPDPENHSALEHQVTASSSEINQLRDMLLYSYSCSCQLEGRISWPHVHLAHSECGPPTHQPRRILPCLHRRIYGFSCCFPLALVTGGGLDDGVVSDPGHVFRSEHGPSISLKPPT